MLWSFLSFNRSAERSTTVLSPRRIGGVTAYFVQPENKCESPRARLSPAERLMLSNLSEKLAPPRPPLPAGEEQALREVYGDGDKDKSEPLRSQKGYRRGDRQWAATINYHPAPGSSPRRLQASA
jgi:hypothetical protein